MGSHGKRRVVEADGLLTAREVADRVCVAFACPHHEHLSVAENVARSCTRDASSSNTAQPYTAVAAIGEALEGEAYAQDVVVFTRHPQRVPRA